MADRSQALTWTELRVGVVVILSLIVLAVTVLYIGSGGGVLFGRKYELKALMSDVNGLKPGAPVRVGGVEVGTVKEVDFAGAGARGMVEVTMSIDRRVQDRVTTESRATLGALGLLGEKAVDITGATRGAPIQDGGYLTADAEDPFKSLLSDASESTTHLRRILSRMDAGEGTLGKALRDEELYQRMVDVSARLQVVTAKLESEAGPLGRLLNDREMSGQIASSARGLEAVIARVEAGQGPLGVLSKDEQMVAELKAVSHSLGEVASRLQKGQGTAGKLLQDEALYQKLDSAAARLDALAARLEKGEGTAGRLVNDPALYDNLNGASLEMRALIGDIRKDPRKYLRIKLALF
jgi:phospholipid/cholesterol/gamma-HCH transport system substrate-binding protein